MITWIEDDMNLIYQLLQLNQYLPSTRRQLGEKKKFSQ